MTDKKDAAKERRWKSPATKGELAEVLLMVRLMFMLQSIHNHAIQEGDTERAKTTHERMLSVDELLGKRIKLLSGSEEPSENG